MPSLIIRAEGEKEERIALESAVVTLGRAIDSDIRLNDVRASRKHCQIIAGPNGYMAVDLGSGNGTKVNGVKIKEHKLNSGDLIQIGSTVLLFSADGAAIPPVPRAAAAVASREEVIQAGFATQIIPRMRETSSTIQPFASQAPPSTANTSAVRRSATGSGTTGSLPIAGGKRTGTTSRRSGLSKTSRTGRNAGATSRFMAQRKKGKGMYVAIGGGVLLIVILYFMFGSGGQSVQQMKERIYDIEKELDVCVKKEDYDQGAKLCDEAMKLCDLINDNEHGRKRRQFRSAKNDFEEHKRMKVESETDYKKLKLKMDNTQVTKEHGKDWEIIVDEVKNAYSKYKETVHGKRFSALLDDSRRFLKESIGESSEQEFAAMQNTAAPLLSAKRYGEAIKIFKEFTSKHSKDSPEGNKALTEIMKINTKAKAEIESIRGIAESKLKEKEGAEGKQAALDYLNEQRERFVGTEAESEFGNVVKDIESRQ